MKKNLNVFFIAAALALPAIGCNSKDHVANEPKAVLVSFFERISKKDIEGAAKLATKDSKATMDMMKKGMEMADKMKDNPILKNNPSAKENDLAEGFKNIEIGDAKINGDEAIVAFKNLKKGVAFDFPLKKEHGSWKVDFSMTTLMKMGMQERGKNGDMDTSMSNQNFNSMNPDSLRNGLQQLDSVIKSVDPEKIKKMMEAMKVLEKTKNN